MNYKGLLTRDDGVKLIKTSGQTVSDATFTDVTFEDTAYDTHSYADLGSNQIKIPEMYDGKYLITAQVFYATNSPDNHNLIVQARIMINGTRRGMLQNIQQFNSATIATLIYNVVKDDTIKIITYQNSGGNLDCKSEMTSLTMHRLSNSLP